MSERYVYGTPIRLGLLKTTNENAPCLRIKVNHVRENFIPNLEQLSLVFYTQNRYWPYSDIADSAYYRLSPGLCRWVSKSSESDNHPRNQSLWHKVTCRQR